MELIKGGDMYDLSYFNLGFRSDSVSNYLEALKTKNCDDDSLLDDAVLIIGDCLKIRKENSLISGFSGTTGNKGYETHTLLPLLAELYLNQTIDSIIADLKNVYETVLKIKNDRKSTTDAEYNNVITFFSNLSDLCLSNSAHQINSEKLKFA